MDFRGFKVEKNLNEIVISQLNNDGEYDRIFLDNKQIPLLIEALIESKPYFLADMVIDQDGIDNVEIIGGNSLEDLYFFKKSFYDNYIENMEQIAYQSDQTELKRIRKVIDITGDL